MNKANRRLWLLIIVMVIWFVIVSFRLFSVQVLNSDYYRKKLENQNKRITEISSQRGDIYDRKNKLLAMTTDSFSLYLQNRNSKQSLDILRKIKSEIELNKNQLLEIKKNIKEEKPFVWLKRKASEREKNRVLNLGLEGVNSITEKKRYYPNLELASHVLGSVNIDNKGIEGIEKHFDNILRGREGKIHIRLDARRKVYEVTELTPFEKGKDIILTLDSTLQYTAEKELKKGVLENKAKNGTVIIVSPYTGEILAMASYPNFNPNDPHNINSSNRKNLAIEFNYEPGSIFKVITACSVIEKEKVKLAEHKYCHEGRYEYKGEIFTDHSEYGYLTPGEIITYSSNIGTIKMAQTFSPKEYYKFEKLFGIGEDTEVELPGESSGIIKPYHKWSGISLVTNAIGYGIMVTPIQMLMAVNVVANGGYYVQPTIVREIDDYKVKIGDKKQIISKKTALKVKDFLKKVVQKGTGQKADIEGFKIAGKTGTTRKVVNKKYSKNNYISSFAGFIPANNPKISMIVIINDPQNEKYYGGDVAAPIFKRIAEQCLNYYEVFPSFLKKKKFYLAEKKIKRKKENKSKDEII